MAQVDDHVSAAFAQIDEHVIALLQEERRIELVADFFGKRIDPANRRLLFLNKDCGVFTVRIACGVALPRR